MSGHGRICVRSKYYGTFNSLQHTQFVHFHTYHATGHASRSFRGIGPSLSWNGSTPVAGNPQGGEVTFDWGANAALLFGRQKARVQHQETAHYKHLTGGQLQATLFYRSINILRRAQQRSNRDRAQCWWLRGCFLSYREFQSQLRLSCRFLLRCYRWRHRHAQSKHYGFYGPFVAVGIGLGG